RAGQTLRIVDLVSRRRGARLRDADGQGRGAELSAAQEIADVPARASIRTRSAAPIGRLEVSAFTVPTDAPESDGTLEWDKTTIVIVHITAGDVTGIGYTYADVSAGVVVEQLLAGIVTGHDALDVEARYVEMIQSGRNVGRAGVAATAISAVDIALWDTKARLLDVPLIALLGAARSAVPVYGSGGFTSYAVGQLQAQLLGWADQGIRAVKMKVGRDPIADHERVR